MLHDRNVLPPAQNSEPFDRIQPRTVTTLEDSWESRTVLIDLGTLHNLTISSRSSPWRGSPLSVTSDIQRVSAMTLGITLSSGRKRRTGPRGRSTLTSSSPDEAATETRPLRCEPGRSTVAASARAFGGQAGPHRTYLGDLRGYATTYFPASITRCAIICRKVMLSNGSYLHRRRRIAICVRSKSPSLAAASTVFAALSILSIAPIR